MSLLGQNNSDEAPDSVGFAQSGAGIVPPATFRLRPLRTPRPNTDVQGAAGGPAQSRTLYPLAAPGNGKIPDLV